MKKILALGLAIVMIFALCACGQTAASTSAATTTTTTETASTEAAAENVKLSVILLTGWEFFEDAINEYCELNPNVEVDVQTMPTTDYKTLIKTKFASNDAPDLVPVMCEADYYDFYRNGYLADLSDMTEITDRLKDGAITAFEVDGGVMGFPFTQEFLLCYYNKDMFEANGLTVPTSWEELLDECEVLKNAGVTPVALGHKDAWVLLMAPYSMNATTVQYADPTFYDGTADGTNKFADNAGWLETLTTYNDFCNSGYVNAGSLSTTSDQMYEMFVNQEAAMFFGGTWCDGSVAAMNPEFTVGGFQIPAPGGSKGTAISITGGFGVNATTGNEEAAKDLLAFIYSKDCLEKYAPTTPTCFKDVTTQLTQALQEGIDGQTGLPGFQYDDTHFANGVQDAMLSAMQEMLGGSKTPLQVLEAMDEATAKANK